MVLQFVIFCIDDKNIQGQFQSTLSCTLDQKANNGKYISSNNLITKAHHVSVI